MEMLNTVRSSKVINDCNMIVTTNYAPENEPWNLKITQLNWKVKIIFPNLHLFWVQHVKLSRVWDLMLHFVSHFSHFNLPQDTVSFAALTMCESCHSQIFNITPKTYLPKRKGLFFIDFFCSGDILNFRGVLYPIQCLDGFTPIACEHTQGPVKA